MNTISNASRSVVVAPERDSDVGSVYSFSSESEGGLDIKPRPVQILIADSEAIFRVGMAKIFAVEHDLEVVAQADNLSQALAVIASTPCDVILFEAGLSATPAEAISEVTRRALPGRQDHPGNSAGRRRGDS